MKVRARRSDGDSQLCVSERVLAALIRGSGGTKSMPKPYSDDLRERVIEAVVAGASRREAAESFSLSANSAVR